MLDFWIQRLTCWLRGHHDLSLAAAYSEILPGGSGKELRYCVRCRRNVDIVEVRQTFTAELGRYQRRLPGIVRSAKCKHRVENGKHPTP